MQFDLWNILIGLFSGTSTGIFLLIPKVKVIVTTLISLKGSYFVPKPEIISKLCTKCHSKTVHEVREKSVVGIRLVCTDCGQSMTVSKM
jgi:ribosomal protein L33